MEVIGTVNVPIAKSAIDTGVFWGGDFSEETLCPLLTLVRSSDISLSGSSTIAFIKLLACRIASG